MAIAPPDQLRYRSVWTAGGILLLLAILVLSLIPYTGPILPVTISDKALHAFAFGSLAVWFSAVVPEHRWLLMFGLLLGYGALIEGLQYFTDYRSIEWGDFVADIGGLTLGWILITAGLGNWASWAERVIGVR
jgi:VanZ family protein